MNLASPNWHRRRGDARTDGRLGPLVADATTVGTIAAMSLWAGQSVGAVKQVRPAQQIVQEMVRDAAMFTDAGSRRARHGHMVTTSRGRDRLHRPAAGAPVPPGQTMELSIREAKARFAEAAAAAARGERVVVTKHGRPFVELVPAQECVRHGFRRRRQSSAASSGWMASR